MEVAHHIPYTAKLSRGKTFAVFTVFQPIAKVFPLNHLPCTVHNGMDLMYRKNFPVNSAFCAQPRKFSPSKVLPYTVSLILYERCYMHNHKKAITIQSHTIYYVVLENISLFASYSRLNLQVLCEHVCHAFKLLAHIICDLI